MERATGVPTGLALRGRAGLCGRTSRALAGLVIGAVQVGAVLMGLVLAGVLAWPGAAHAQERVLASSGPLSSIPGGHQTGADLIWAVPDGASAGLSAYATLDYRLAMPFTLDADATVRSVVVYGYQQGAIAGPTIDFLGVEVWDGRPDLPTSRRLAGDASVDALTDASFAGAYVALSGVDFANDRPVYALRAGGLSWSLPAGEYWLVWSMDGWLDGGPYSPYLGDRVRPTPGPAMQRFLGAWRPATTSSDGGPQVALPFEVLGETLCPADCDGDGALTIFDYLCFQNAFDAGQAEADCDGDGTLTAADMACYQALFLGGCP